MPISAEDREKQRRSFAFGNACIADPNGTEETIDEAAETLVALNELTISEIMMGIMLYIGPTRFTEQELYRFLKRIDFSDRFKVRRVDSGLYSFPVRTTLSFMEMGMMFEDWGDSYKVRDSIRSAMLKDLIERRVLPKRHVLFQRLACQFVESLV